MKKQHVLSCAALFASALLFSSCQKLIDKYFPPNGGGDGNHQPDCRIATVLYDNASVYTVYYNAHGDPDSIANGDNPQFAFTPYVFKYNAQHQLTDYYYGSSSVGQHSWYTWQSGRIVRDSTRFVGAFVLDIIVATPEYDSKGRVIRDSIMEDYSNEGDRSVTHYSRTYTYGPDGNLKAFYQTGAGQPTTEAIPYDSKVNYLRTNPIWTFLARNYSTNNQVGASGYNAEGLPLGFPAIPRAGESGFLVDRGNPKAITYDCP
jgi:hypothetical protein